MELPYGWAGSIVIEHDVIEVDKWCNEYIKNTERNCILTVYGEQLCQLEVRKEKDFALVALRWR